MKNILIPSAPGELIDKITILQIKSKRIEDNAKLQNIRHELELLSSDQKRLRLNNQTVLKMQAILLEVNERIWDLEDTIRECERKKNFGDVFLKTSRAIYKTNDKRAEIKKEINLYLGSEIVEEKSYVEY